MLADWEVMCCTCRNSSPRSSPSVDEFRCSAGVGEHAGAGPGAGTEADVGGGAGADVRSGTGAGSVSMRAAGGVGIDVGARP